jgi:hypothetical protein
MAQSAFPVQIESTGDIQMKNLYNQLENVAMSGKIPCLAALLALILTLPSLGLGFMADDYMQRAVFLQPESLEGMFGEPFKDFFTFADGDPERMKVLVDRGLYPWMVVPDLRMSFWRPLTVATHYIDYQLWPDSPFLMHVHNLIWFTLMVALAGYFYRAIMGPTLAAGLAVTLFAVDDAHAWPAAWIANRNAPIAMVLCLLVLMLHHRWRKGGRVWVPILSVALFGVALLAKESTIAAFGYLFAYALFLDKGRTAGRIFSLLPYVAVTIIWRIVYVQLNFGAKGSGGYIDPLGDPLQFANAFLTRAPVLLQSQWAFIPSDTFLFAPPVLKTFVILWSVAVVIGLSVVLYPLLKRYAAARFWCLGMLFALVPLVAADPQDRLLLFPGLGAMGLLAQLLVSLKSGEFTEMNLLVPPAFLKPLRYGLVGIHLVMAPILLPVMILVLGFLMGNIDHIVKESLPSDKSIVGKTFILTNGANYPVGTYLHIIRGLEGEPTPAHVRSFAPVSMAAIPMTITRITENSAVVRPDGGYPWSIFRNSDHPFALGETIALAGMTVEITELAEEGWPSEVTYIFEKSLDDPSYLWFRINGTNYESMHVPGVGETVRLNPFD